ncbi:unnamed protein product [Ectocarpus sp. CCAP 1310/34]|nr:unnamed protein product [Ectocarpus sp. CCAP 1310/34]
MGTPVRAAVGRLRALGPHASGFADYLSCNTKGFLAANEEVSESFPLVVRRSGAKGYGLLCGPRPASLPLRPPQCSVPMERVGEELLRVPPAVWLPYCAEAAVRKAEAGAPDFLARLSNTCAKIGGGDALEVAPVACLALELLFTLERDAREPYLGLLWEASTSEDALPHPLLMGPDHLDLLQVGADTSAQASPLRDSITAASKIYSTLHRSLFGLEGGDADSSSRGGVHHAGIQVSPSASTTRDFLWALGVILSRGVSEEGAGGVGLVPYLDFANHGDGGKGGGVALGDGGASCERGFDAATGRHVLRALRDIAPGEELLIDYGSAAKGAYRFARTYGFVNFRQTTGGGGGSSSSSSSSNSNSNSSAGSNAGDNGEPSNDNGGGGSDDNDDGGNRGRRLIGGIPSGSDSLRVHVGLSSPAGQEQKEQQQQLVVPVRLADVAAAAAATFEEQVLEEPNRRLLSPETDQEGEAADVFSGAVAATAKFAAGARAAQPGTRVAVAAAEVEALEERLRRYPTTWQEDLELLGLVASDGTEEDNSADGTGGTRRPQTEKTSAAAGAKGAALKAGAASGAVTAEWAETCISLRAAEKIALQRALRTARRPR